MLLFIGDRYCQELKDTRLLQKSSRWEKSQAVRKLSKKSIEILWGPGKNHNPKGLAMVDICLPSQTRLPNCCSALIWQSTRSRHKDRISFGILLMTRPIKLYMQPLDCEVAFRTESQDPGLNKNTLNILSSTCCRTVNI